MPVAYKNLESPGASLRRRRAKERYVRSPLVIHIISGPGKAGDRDDRLASSIVFRKVVTST